MAIIYKNILKNFSTGDFARNHSYFDYIMAVFWVAEFDQLIRFCKFLIMFSPLCSCVHISAMNTDHKNLSTLYDSTNVFTNQASKSRLHIVWTKSSFPGYNIFSANLHIQRAVSKFSTCHLNNCSSHLKLFFIQ